MSAWPTHILPPLRRNGRCRRLGDSIEPKVHRSHYPARCRAGLSRPERGCQDGSATATGAAARPHRCHGDPLGSLPKPGKYCCPRKRAAAGRVTRRMTATRRLAAILAADVAGYSRLMGADEEGTLERLKALRRELADPKIREHRGRIVKTTGDGLLIE